MPDDGPQARAPPVRSPFASGGRAHAGAGLAAAAIRRPSMRDKDAILAANAVDMMNGEATVCRLPCSTG